MPATPVAPTTTFLRETVKINWTEPDTLGSPIKEYNVYIKQQNGTYNLELNNCDATDLTIVGQKYCIVQVSTLKNAPFSLEWGSSIFAKVVAINDYGRSIESPEGNGAVIITYADKPTNLAEIVSARTATTITFTWIPGLLNGGSTVTDYQIFRKKEGDSSYISIATNVTTPPYTATGLETGKRYLFTVQASNGFGYSESSDPVTILCATKPVTPVAPETSVLND